MTREEWDKEWLDLYNREWIATKDHAKSFEAAHRIMKNRRGERPQGVPGLPWWVSIAALTFGVRMNPLFSRIVTSLLYAVGVAIAAYQATVPPISTEGWIGLVVAGVVAFWGKFSSSTTIVAPNRAGETF